MNVRSKHPHPAIRFVTHEATGEILAESTARLCVRCVLPETFPDLRFDAEGVCEQCLTSEPPAVHQPEALRAEIATILASADPTRAYDCLAMYSGGKDSSMALVELRRTYGLRVLAFTLDNGFLASQTHGNMRAVLDHLGIDHVTVRPAGRAMKRLYKLSLKEPFGTDTTKYSTSACGACISVVLATARELAAEKRIPLVAGGWTPGQLTNAPIVPGAFLADVAERHFGPLETANASEGGLDPSFARFRAAANGAASPIWPSLFNPLYGARYGEEDIVRALAALGWSRPADTDSCSTNCRLNGFLIVHHLRAHGFHPYVYELAQHVRAGFLARDEALAKMRRIRVDARTVRQIGRELETQVAPATAGLA